MKRDADYIRELLLEFEASDDWRILDVPTIGATPEEERRTYHIQLMCDQGLLMVVSSSAFRITSLGHDFLDATAMTFGNKPRAQHRKLAASHSIC